MDSLCLSGKGLTLEQVISVARDNRPVAIAPGAEACLKEGRELIFELMDKGVKMYGCNTGVGWNKDVIITDELLAQFNQGMLYSHAIAVPPYASEEETRAAMLLRLNTLLAGCTGLSVHIPQMYVEFLNRGISPLIPERGSVGQADIGCLSFVGLAMRGIGDVRYKGNVVPAADALAAEGLEPTTLGAKDGLAIISSNAFGAGQAAITVWEVSRLIQMAELIYCVSLEGLSGNVTPLKVASLELRGYPHPVESAKAMAEHLKGSWLHEPKEDRPLQDPLSFRNGPHLYGEARRSVQKAIDMLEIQFNNSDDNPCLNLSDRTASSCSNFDPLPWVLEVQALSVCLAHLSKAACLRIIKLINPGFTQGLPRNLQPSPTVMAYTTIHKAYSTLDAQIRNLCNPVSMDCFSISGEMEDISTNSPLVVQNLRKIADNLSYIFGIELLIACQAIDLREGIRLGEGTARAHKLFREKVAFYDADNRVLTDDIQAARDLLKSGALLD